MKASAESWLEFARKDLQGAKTLLNEKGLENLVLFHCQQAIEKLLKAILSEHNVKFPKIHGTRTLYELILNNISPKPELDENTLLEIDSVYVDARYPNELGLLPSGFPTQEETKRIYEDSKNLFGGLEKLLS
ncbi:MAG: HEPN domain-containing protein [Bacteroidales bacterium]|nr:HEPN domain-containing protein [Bacteroidales bacterium]